MKKQKEKKSEEDYLVNAINLRGELRTLSDVFKDLDCQSLHLLTDFQCLSNARKREINEAFRKLKRTIIFAQTDLWTELVRLVAPKPPAPDEVKYHIYMEHIANRDKHPTANTPEKKKLSKRLKKKVRK